MDVNNDNPEGQEELIEEKIMALDEYYPEDHIEKKLPDSSISTKYAKFHGSFGMESGKRYNLHYLAKNTIIYSCGNTYQIFNYMSKQKQVFFGHDTGGIGSIAVDPKMQFFAIAEKGVSPNIYIYEFPSLKLYRILRKGTDRSYANIEFSKTGEKLCSVGGEPDYTLAVWDWKKEKIILKAKAYGQDVFKVSFSPFSDGQLITSGTGHIKFWKMAKTFTGLKLQGELGKFGQLELSDVSGFAELPDGKVLSGTEYGTLILWEGNLVKAQLVQESVPRLHDGAIECVILEDKCVITAGADGFVKWWDFEEIDNAEADETVNVVISDPKFSKKIEGSHQEIANIINMIRGDDHWLISDANGKIWTMMASAALEYGYKEIMCFHSGNLVNLSFSHQTNAAVSLGTDGVVKLWDFAKETKDESYEAYSRKFMGKGTSMDWMPYTERSVGRIIAAGFSNGIVRILLLDEKNFKILTAFKAHDSEVIKVAYSPDGKWFVTGGSDGTIFFFEIDHTDMQNYIPICMHDTTDKIMDLKWDSKSLKIIIGLFSGKVLEIRRPEAEKIDTNETYLTELDSKKWILRMMEFQMKKNQPKEDNEEEKKKKIVLPRDLLNLRPKEEEVEEKEWDPEAILACSYAKGDDKFMVTADGLFRGYIYLCEFENERPLKVIDYGNKNINCIYLTYTEEYKYLICSFTNGSLQLRHTANTEKYMELSPHDCHTGAVVGVGMSYLKNYILSAGKDGIIFAHTLLQDAIEMEAKDQIPPPNMKFPEDTNTITQLGLDTSLQFISDLDIDILDDQIYSIQQAKLRTEEDHKQRMADLKKERVRGEIIKLRDEYQAFKEKNLHLEDHLRLEDNEISIDGEFLATVEEETRQQIEETEKELAYKEEWHKVALQKLKDKYLDVLDCNMLMVKAIDTDSFVRTFRLGKKDPSIASNLDAYVQKEFAEMRRKSAVDDDLVSLERESVGMEELGSQDVTISKFPPIKEGTMSQIVPQSADRAHKTQTQKTKEDRKVKRIERKKRILQEKEREKEFKNRKINEKDLLLIEKYKSSMGDYKLKSSEDYKVPKHERINAPQKRHQMLLLESSMHNIKAAFNAKVIQMKSKKQEIIQKIKASNEKLRAINEKLKINPEDSFLRVEIDTILETPEKFLDVNDKEVKEFVKEKKRKLREEMQKKKGKYAGGASAKEEHDEESEESDEGEKELTTEREAKRDPIPARKVKKTQPSSLEEEIKKVEEIKLKYEKDLILTELRKEIGDFDKDIGNLEKERLMLESDLKNAEMKLIIHYDELFMLNGLEERDHKLTERLDKAKQEKTLILKELNEISKQLKEKEKETENIKNEIQNCFNNFYELVPQEVTEYKELYEFFTRRIRRKKKEPEEKEADDIINEEEEEEESEEDEDEEGLIDEESDNMTAMKFNQDEHKIEDIEHFREEKLNWEEKLKKTEKATTELNKKRQNCNEREERINSELNRIEHEIQLFHRDKMRRLNRLEVSFVLRLEQMQNLIRNEEKIKFYEERNKEKRIKLQEKERAEEESMRESMQDQSRMSEMNDALQTLNTSIMEKDDRGHYIPTNIAESILFTKTQIRTLLDTEKRMKQECTEQDVMRKKIKTDIKKLTDEKKKLNKIKNEKKKEYEEELQLKFGEIINLDHLVTVGYSEAVQKRKQKFDAAEKESITKIRKAEEELEKKKRELSEKIKENTQLLNHITHLGEQRNELHSNLEKSNKQIFDLENTDEKAKLIKEREKIKEVLELQTERIAVLKKEIELFKRKGGHIYTTITANRRVAGMGPENP